MSTLPPGLGGPPVVAAAWALEALARGAGVELLASEIQAMLERARAGSSDADRGSEIARLDVVATELGLRTLRFDAPLAAALGALEPGACLVTPLAPGGGNAARWLVLTRVGARRVEATVHADAGSDDGGAVAAATRTTHALSGTAIARELDLDAEEPHAWLGAVSALPCAEAGSEAGASEPLTPFARLRQLLRPERRDIQAVVVFAIVNGVLLLATPVAVQALVNFVAFGGAIPPLVIVALGLLLVLGFAALLSALQAWTVELLQRRLFVRMFADLAARLPRVTLRSYDTRYGPEVVNRFFDIVTVQKIGSALLLDGLGVLLSVLVGLVVLAFYHPLLLAFDIVLLVVIALIVLGPVRRGTRTAIQESKAKYASQAWLEEIARNPLLFKSAGAQRWIYRESDRLAREWVGYRTTHFRIVFGQVLAALALQAVANTAVLAIGGLLVIQGSLTLGQLVAAELIVTLVVSSVAKLGKHIEGIYDLMASMDKLGQLLDLPLEDATGEHPPEPPLAAALTFDGVTWRTLQGEPLFVGLDLEVPAGSSLGVTGPSGSGKTTLVELLWGLRRPTAGSVRIDGRDLRDLSLDWLRRTASFASRAEVVAGTIRENVALARPFVTDDDVRAALDAVGLLEDVHRLPDGLGTVLRPDGHPLSAGQVQSMVVARAVVGSPRLLLFDDPIDQLSRRDRERVLDLLFAPDSPWTLVIVSNDPQTLQRCDRVLEMPLARSLDERSLSA